MIAQPVVQIFPRFSCGILLKATASQRNNDGGEPKLLVGLAEKRWQHYDPQVFAQSLDDR
jgi:hypothetical protein